MVTKQKKTKKFKKNQKNREKMVTKHEKMFYIINFLRNTDENLTATRMQVKNAHVERMWCHLEPTYTAVAV